VNGPEVVLVCRDLNRLNPYILRVAWLSKVDPREVAWCQTQRETLHLVFVDGVEQGISRLWRRFWLEEQVSVWARQAKYPVYIFVEGAAFDLRSVEEIEFR